ncbi:MAG: class I SAM-dependent methyltransferase [bacterium]|nr:class I SAM-dependent methyltransferase [bacterium]
MVFLDPERHLRNAREYYGSVFYPEGYSGRKGSLGAFSYRFFLLDKHFPKGGKFLEVGAGSGDFLHLLKEKGYNAEGVELSRRAVEQAKENYNSDLFCGTLNEAAFNDYFFDFIAMYHVLEHVPNPLPLLKEVNRVLKPGGVLLIELPHVTGVDARLSRRLLENILDYPNHLYLFPQKTIKKMLLKSGFEILETEKSFSFLAANLARKLITFKQRKSKLSDSKREGAVCEPQRAIKKLRAPKILRNIFPGMKLTIVAKKP